MPLIKLTYGISRNEQRTNFFFNLYSDKWYTFGLESTSMFTWISISVFMSAFVSMSTVTWCRRRVSTSISIHMYNTGQTFKLVLFDPVVLSILLPEIHLNLQANNLEYYPCAFACLSNWHFRCSPTFWGYVLHYILINSPLLHGIAPTFIWVHWASVYWKHWKIHY